VRSTFMRADDHDRAPSEADHVSGVEKGAEQPEKSGEWIVEREVAERERIERRAG